MNLIQKSVAVAVLSLGSAAAFATTPNVPAFNPTPGAISPGTNGNGALLVAVWDVVSNSSLVQYLGLGYNDVGIPTMSDSDFLDFGTLSGFSTTFAAAIGANATSRLQYMVFAVDSQSTDGIGGTGIRATGAANYATAVAVGSDPLSFGLQVQSAGPGWIADTFNTTLDSATQCLQINPCSVVNNGTTPKYWGNVGGDLGGLIPASTSFAGAVGTALSFYETTVSLAAGGEPEVGPYVFNPILVATGIGNQFLLSSAGQLTFGDNAPVPLPAAAWLLLSGLAGLGAVARRRQAA